MRVRWISQRFVAAFTVLLTACTPPASDPPRPGSSSSVSDRPIETPTAPVLPPRCDRLPNVGHPVLGPDVGTTDKFVFDAEHQIVWAAGNTVYWRTHDGRTKELTVRGAHFRALVPFDDGRVLAFSWLPDQVFWLHSAGRVEPETRMRNGRAALLGPDGFLYVLSSHGDHVRRVNVETWDATVVATGLREATDIAMGPDPTRLYVSGRHSSSIAVVYLTAPGALGTVSTFATLDGGVSAEPLLDPCDGKVAGDRCFIATNPGTCSLQQGVLLCEAGSCFTVDDDGVCEATDCAVIGKGTWSCIPPNACHARSEGDACGPNEAGICQPHQGNLYCHDPGDCADQVPGDRCTVFGVPGTCVPSGGSIPACVVDACAAGWHNDGEPCELPDGPGTCIDDWIYPKACKLNTCAQLNVGDLCFFDRYYQYNTGTITGSLGSCILDASNNMRCVSNTCASADAGGACRGASGDAGACDDHHTPPQCVSTCGQDAVAGDRCTIGDQAGRCAGPRATCERFDCNADNIGTACTTANLRPGTCQFQLDLRRPTCVADNPCVDHVGEPCSYGGVFGRCTADHTCEGNCEHDNGQVPCADRQRMVQADCWMAGDACGVDGVCKRVQGELQCIDGGEAARHACLGLLPSTACNLNGAPGVCGEDQVCHVGERGLTACAGRSVGESCVETSTGVALPGRCEPSALGPMCAAPRRDRCATRQIGESCAGYSNTICQEDTTGAVRCEPWDFGALLDECGGRQSGAPCGDGGYCQNGDGPGLCLEPSRLLPPCAGKAVGDTCQFAGAPVLRCGVAPQPGLPLLCGAVSDPEPLGIGALAIDACGNVYASQMTSGFLYRIDPTGVARRIAAINAAKTTAMQFGHGSKSDALFVLDVLAGRLWEVEVGVPGPP